MRLVIPATGLPVNNEAAFRSRACSHCLLQPATEFVPRAITDRIIRNRPQISSNQNLALQRGSLPVFLTWSRHRHSGGIISIEREKIDIASAKGDLRRLDTKLDLYLTYTWLLIRLRSWPTFR